MRFSFAVAVPLELLFPAYHVRNGTIVSRREPFPALCTHGGSAASPTEATIPKHPRGERMPVKNLLSFLFLILFLLSSQVMAQDRDKLVETGKKADILNFKAIQYYMERDYERAAKTYEEVISICEEMKKRVGNNSEFNKKMDSIIMDKLTDCAECYQIMGSLDKARENYIKAGTLAEKYSDNTGRLKILCNLATLARESSDFKQFIIYCKEVEHCLENVTSLENLTPQELIPQAEILNRYRLLSIERSALLHDMGRIDEALACLNSERILKWHRTLCRLFTPDSFLPLFNSIKKTNPEMIQDILNIIYINIKSEICLRGYQGQYLLARGDCRKALSSFDSVETYLKSIDLSKINNNFDACIAYLREIADGTEPYIKPIIEHTITKLSKFKDEEIDMEYQTFMIENSIRRAQTYKAMGEYDKAVELFRKILKDSEKLDNYRKAKIPAVMMEMSEISFLKGDYKESLNNALKAKESLKYAPLDFRTPWKLHTLFGKLCEKDENLPGALESYKNAIDYIEKLHSLLYIGKRREKFFGERIEPYEGIIRTLVRMNRPAEAFQYVEKAKARSLSEHFGATFFESNTSPESRKKMELSFHKVYTKLEMLEDSEQTNKPVASEEAFAIEENLKKITGDLRTISSFKGFLDDYANFVCAATISVEDTMKLADDSSVILEFFYDTTTPAAMQRVYLFLITPETIKAETLTVSPGEMEKEIGTLREKILENDESWKDEASLLYNQMLGPVESFLGKGKRLIIVPHKVMHYLPFSALITGNGKPLIEDYPVVYTPSLTSLKFCRDKKSAEGENMVFFCLGNTSYDDFPALPGTLLEAKQIEKIFNHVTVIKEKEFTRSRIFNELSGRNIIHFATHGVFDADDPGNSGLITSDGKLTVEDIMDSKRFKLSSRMVTLSACKTGLGKLYPGDEVEGLTRAFMYAGTPSVLSTLWSVADESTADLMKYFYENLMKDMSLDESLRQAEIRLMKDHPHPYYWAPFILTGYWKN